MREPCLQLIANTFGRIRDQARAPLLDQLGGSAVRVTDVQNRAACIKVFKELGRDSPLFPSVVPLQQLQHISLQLEPERRPVRDMWMHCDPVGNTMAICQPFDVRIGLAEKLDADLLAQLILQQSDGGEQR